MNQQGGGPPGQQGYGGPQPPQGGYDPAMMPRQYGAPNLEGWNPGSPSARSGMAWAAIILAAWMALVRVGQGLLALAVTSGGRSGGTLLGGGIFSFVAAAFYVWAVIGLYKGNPAAYRSVVRVNILLAVLSGIQIFLAFGGQGIGVVAIVAIIGVVFHVVAALVTNAAGKSNGSAWG